MKLNLTVLGNLIRAWKNANLLNKYKKCAVILEELEDLQYRKEIYIWKFIINIISKTFCVLVNPYYQLLKKNVKQW